MALDEVDHLDRERARVAPADDRRQARLGDEELVRVDRQHPVGPRMAGLEREPVGQVGLAEGAGIALDLQRQLQRQLAEQLTGPVARAVVDHQQALEAGLEMVQRVDPDQVDRVSDDHQPEHARAAARDLARGHAQNP